MAFKDKDSSRAAQLALSTASAAEQVSLSSGLHGLVRSAMKSKNANYLVTKAVEVMPPGRAGFIPKELLGHGSEEARHRFGCRILCRVLEHYVSPRDETTMKLLDEVLKDADHLCTHAFGSIVIRHFLEHGLAEHKRCVVEALRKNLMHCAQQRKGSHVVEAAFQYCSPEDCRLLAQQILGNDEQLLELATGQFGRHVLVTLLRMDGVIGQQATQALLPFAKQLLASKYGKSVHAALSLSMGSDGTAVSPSQL